MSTPPGGRPAPGAPGRTRTLVKICGLTRREDAELALECGADWLGFIVAAGGPREIGTEGMAGIVSAFPGAIGVAVLAGVGPDQALSLGLRARARRLQIHDVDPAGWPAAFPLPCAFVTGVDGAGQAQGPLAPPPHLIHLDTSRGGRTGGTGQVFPWTVAHALSDGRPFVLSGGLGPDNVAAAIAAAAPFAVDACSRLESSPGLKDPDLVRRFVAAAKEHDGRAPADA